MKNKIFKIFSIFIISCISIIGLMACDNEEKFEHKHNFTSVVIAPTCTESGYTTHTCSCGENYNDTYVSALDHEFTNYISDNNATQEVDGTKTAICNRAGCDETNTITDVGSKLPTQEHTHSYTDSISAPTCTEQGYTTHTCSCGASYIDTYISALDHEFTNYISDNNATQEADGTKTAICNRIGCDETDTIIDVGSKLAGRGLVFTKNADGLSQSVTGLGTCTDSEVIIPSEYEGLPVTVIARGCFYGENSIVSVVIPSSVLIIEDSAFSQCKNLQTIDISSGVKSIGMSFTGCESLKNVHIPDTITFIDTLAFYLASSIEQISVDETNKSYSSANGALFNKEKTSILYFPPASSIIDVVIPSTVTTVGSYSFVNCKKIKTVVMSNSVETIKESAFQGCEELAEITMSNSISRIENYVFGYCRALKNIIIPNKVTLVYPYIFDGCINLETVYISKNVTTIVNNPFADCVNLKTIYFGGTSTAWEQINYSSEKPSYEGIEIIFEFDCSCNHEVIIDESKAPTCTNSGLTEGSHCKLCGTVFKQQDKTEPLGHLYIDHICSRCGLEYYTEGLQFTCNDITKKVSVTGYIGANSQVYIPSTFDGKTVTEIAANAFYGCSNIASAHLPQSITKIGYNAFYGCSNLSSVYISDLANWCAIDFYLPYSNPLIYANNLHLNGELITILITTGINTISKYAFYGYKSLTSIVFTNDMVTIGDSAFSNCSSLASINISNTVTNIGNYAFSECSSLIGIKIPNSVVEIGVSTFSNCNSLTSISVEKENEAYYSAGNCLIQIHGKRIILGCQNSIIPNDGSVIEIGSSAFSGCSYLTSIDIPDCITRISSSAFKGCSGLKNIIIPSSVTTIQSYAFNGCVALESITIAGNITALNDYTFNGCSSLKEFIIPNSVTKIGEHVFSGCSSLTSITIPNNITKIGSYAFSKCNNLRNIEIPNNVTTIGEYVFWDCSNLREVTLSNNIYVIPKGIFSGCTNLASIIIPQQVTTINMNAFYCCTGLVSVVVPDSVKTIDQWAFYNCSSLTNIYYEGTSKEWDNIVVSDNGNSRINNTTKYYYSATKPSTGGNYWYYVNGVPIMWE